MMFGLGAEETSATTPAAVPLPGFTDGLKLWTSPSTAVTALTVAVKNPSAAFASQIMPFTAGLLIVPVGIIALLFTATKGGR